jgi:predicted DNA repair protein MutK
MAGASLLALIDDIATILDDVAVMTKVAVKKTAGVLGDDLALNAQQVAGVRAERELPVVWAVGRALLVAAPRLMKALAVIGTAAMFMVGGGILTHGIAPLHHAIEHAAEAAGSIAAAGGVLKALTPTLLDMIAGVVAGGLALAGVRAFGAAAAALKGRRQAGRR